MYVAKRADDGVAVSTPRVDLATIRTAHLLAGFPLNLRDPRLALVVEGYYSSLRHPAATAGHTRRAGRAAPAALRLPAVRHSTRRARPRHAPAGFGAALRRSELVALQLRDIKSVPNRGIRLLVQRSKTGKYGKSQDLAVQASPADPAVCPLAALQEWQAHRIRQLICTGRGPRAYGGSGRSSLQ